MVSNYDRYFCQCANLQPLYEQTIMSGLTPDEDGMMSEKEMEMTKMFLEQHMLGAMKQIETLVNQNIDKLDSRLNELFSQVETLRKKKEESA